MLSSRMLLFVQSLFFEAVQTIDHIFSKIHRFEFLLHFYTCLFDFYEPSLEGDLAISLY